MSRSQMYRLLFPWICNSRLSTWNNATNSWWRNCMSIPHSWAKRNMFNVFYMGRTWILSECYKFFIIYVDTILIFEIHNAIMLKIIILKKIRITDENFHLLMIILGHHWTLYCTEMGKSLFCWTLWKLPIISKNCLNKSCWELNFI